jgi:hypothetical protein
VEIGYRTLVPLGHDLLVILNDMEEPPSAPKQPDVGCGEGEMPDKKTDIEGKFRKK